MNRRPRRTAALAAGLVAVAALGWVPSAGPAAAAPVAAAPPGSVRLVDDTGTLSVAVPAEWSDVDTTPGTNDDGTTMPWISASTDFAAYQETFDVPGMVFAGVTYTTDLQFWIDRLGETSTCPSSAVNAYDSAGFVGIDAVAEGCGPQQQATLRTIVANFAADTTMTYVIQVQSPTADDLTDVAPILASLEVSPAGAPGDGAAADAAPEAPQEPEVPEVPEVPDAAPAPAAPEQPSALPEAAAPPVVTLPDGTPLVPAPPPGETSPGGTPGPTTTVAGGPAVFTPTNSVAEGALRLLDDTRTISVAVPPDWAQSATAPTTDDPAGPLPQILASPDLAAFSAPGAFGVAGARYVARPFVADTAAALTAAAAGLPCTAGVVQAYTDPVFTGHILQLTDCGGTAARVYLVAASPASSSMTAVLHIQVTDPDDSDLQTILSSFNVDPAAPAPGTATTVPPTTVPAAPATGSTISPVPSSTLPGVATTAPLGVFTPPAAFPDDTVGVVDDTGLLQIGVPPAWTDWDTAPFVDADGTGLPYIAASPDLSQFIHDPATGPDPFVVPGVIYVGLPYTADTVGAIPQFVEGEACTEGPLQEYQDPVFTGHIQQFTACGGTQTRLFVVVANPADSMFTAVLIVQVTDDPSVLNTVLATFNYDATAPAPGTAPTPTTSVATPGPTTTTLR